MPQEKGLLKKPLNRALRMIVLQNPVFSAGLALTPIVVGAFTLKNGVGLSIAFAVVTIPVLLLASVFGMIKKRVQLPSFVFFFLYVLAAAFLLVPARFLAAGVSPNLFDSLGMYFSLVALNSVWILRVDAFEEKKLLNAFLEGVFYALGFAAAACLVALLREVLTYGTLWGNPLGLPVRFPAVGAAFAGFILIGFLSAALRWMIAGIKNLLRLSQQRIQNLEEK